MLIEILRTRPGQEPRLESFEVPADPADELTVMDLLDYISRHLDPTLGYYKHSACGHGICGRCLLTVNGKPALACITKADPSGRLVLEPAPNRAVVRDLVTWETKSRP